ncbi:hypothetical protein GCM10010300_01030 [Streptomyces olivaceoviridis]|uniref:DUF397 domain-containing protein n=1 Tax=Streptomyces olivaceoviridis TaxID=1921 RepID=UPI0019AC9C02|nr:DUF397 domain-containing protein [Streptomyces olivaceoviridis]GGY61944.1 hypothetical protein GCM10010300_01030 [Streptomyces olivaceoviridis]
MRLGTWSPRLAAGAPPFSEVNLRRDCSRWRSHSGAQGGSCVEVAELAEATVAVRDSKNPAGPILILDPAAFSAFVSRAATGAE